jgi:hypothetical protein
MKLIFCLKYENQQSPKIRFLEVFRKKGQKKLQKREKTPFLPVKRVILTHIFPKKGKVPTKHKIKMSKNLF